MIITKKLKEAWYFGKEISSQKVTQLLINAVFASRAKVCIIDGYPRNIQNWQD